MLSLKGVTAGYGDSTVLRDIDFTVGDGEVVALLGPNGAGKTTLLKTATGFIKPRSGTVEFADVDLTGHSPHDYARRGVCHLPEGRGIFPSLTVRDNLVIYSRGRDANESVAAAIQLFPPLAKKLKQVAGSMSGGEQQMLALSRAYITNPKVVLVDEASLGLAPIMVDKIYEALLLLVERGMSLVLVEQYVQKALDLASRVYILKRGSVGHEGSAKNIEVDEIYEKYLGIET